MKINFLKSLTVIKTNEKNKTNKKKDVLSPDKYTIKQISKDN